MTTEKCKTCGIKYKDCDCFLEFTNLSDNLKKYKHIYVITRIVKKKFNENLKKKFLMDRNFTTIISISFILLLQKVVHPYELIDQCNFITDNFQSHLNIEDITDADYSHAKRVCKDFKTRNIGDYHDLYVESDTLLLADVFQNFRNRYLRKNELDPASFLSPSGLT